MTNFYETREMAEKAMLEDSCVCWLHYNHNCKIYIVTSDPDVSLDLDEQEIECLYDTEELMKRKGLA